jgi:hypothetical protein
LLLFDIHLEKKTLNDRCILIEVFHSLSNRIFTFDLEIHHIIEAGNVFKQVIMILQSAAIYRIQSVTRKERSLISKTLNKLYAMTLSKNDDEEQYK